MRTPWKILAVSVAVAGVVLTTGCAHRGHHHHDRDNNPPGWAGGPGTNWENPPGPLGGPGASPNHRRWWR